MPSMFAHTLAIFECLSRELPPLVPEDVRESMDETIRELRQSHEAALVELEDIMIVFGKEIWPYREAFRECMARYEGGFGESFFTARLPRQLVRRYSEFQAHGGTLRDLMCSQPRSFFSADERGMLCDAIVRMREDVRAHAVQAVLSVDRAVYQEKIRAFQKILTDIEERLDALLALAEREEDHPEFAGEIREHVRAFEYGLCSLGPSISYPAVCNALEHFEGRRLEKKI